MSNKSPQNVAKFKYLQISVINHRYIHEQGLIAMGRIKLYKPIILPFVLCRCETWSGNPREEYTFGIIIKC